jgi:hypothetical protein
MKTLIVLFNLKEGISETDYLQFARELDVPTVKSLKSVHEFELFKASGLFGSDSPPPYQYFEVITFNSVDELVFDMGKEPKMADIPAKFQTFADNPIFILTDKVA